MLDDGVRGLLDGKNFATVATVGPAGAPQTSVMWVMRDGDALLMSTTARRRKVRNPERDARVSVSVHDRANPYRSAEIRGTAEPLPDDDKRLPRELSRKHTGQEPPSQKDEEVRLIVRVTPQKAIRFSASPPGFRPGRNRGCCTGR
ncbi:PPOX class F420-dependent oxidoreductase [Streptomyces xantholiticus]|uniref:PPOX class F420-dependent oxidoreductase n=1 Tax=Streptomyces xantholiticus TaxID=68285 RepID=UPI001E532287|nr:PPOX class F420-dependent oxidoreductase [Streptomyces xantholiticus]